LLDAPLQNEAYESESAPIAVSWSRVVPLSVAYCQTAVLGADAVCCESPRSQGDAPRRSLVARTGVVRVGEVVGPSKVGRGSFPGLGRILEDLRDRPAWRTFTDGCELTP